MKSSHNFLHRTYPSTPLNPKLMFHSVLYFFVQLAPFGCVTKLSAKWAELVQKFVPRSRVLSFRNKHTRLPPLGPKLIFWCVSYYLVTFSTVWLPYKTWCKTAEVVQKFVPWSRVRIFRNECTHPPHWTQNSCFIVFYTIFVPWSRVRIFRYKCTRSTLLDPYLLLWGVSYYLGAFGIVWLPYKILCKTGWSGAKLRAMKSCRNFSQQSTPLDPNLIFRCIS